MIAQDNREHHIQARAFVNETIRRAITKKKLNPEQCTREQIVDTADFLLEYMSYHELQESVDCFLLDYKLQQFKFGDSDRTQKKRALSNLFNVLRFNTKA
jgi:hypothetical protein